MKLIPITLAAFGAFVVNGGYPLPAGGFNVAFFYEDSFDVGAATTYVATSHPNVPFVLPGNSESSQNTAIIAAGYRAASGLPYYVAWCGTGNTVNCLADTTNSIAWVEQYIDCLVRGTSGSQVTCTGPGGTSFLYVNEPDLTAPTSGWNVVYNYVHSHYPNVPFGPILSSSDGVPGASTYLAAGARMDYAIEEQFVGPGCCSGSTDDWAADRIAYPGVKFGEMPVSTAALCTNHQLELKTFGGVDDIEIIWNINLYGQYSGLPLDADWGTNSNAFTSTGDKSICVLPQVYFAGSTNTPQTSNISLSVTDNNAWPGWTPASTVSTCQYQVISGPNAVYGVGASGNVVTQAWTSRTCNSSFTVTVGASGNCRNDSGATQTCIVEMRSQAANGSYGDTIYTLYYIAGI